MTRFFTQGNKKLHAGLPNDIEWVGTVLFEVSPFGKRESFIAKMKKTLDVFGLEFFIYFSLKFIKSKLTPGHSVKAVLSQASVPLFTLEGSINSAENLQILSDLKADLFVSIGGNQVFKRALLDIPTQGTINLHTALLPKYRGLMPSFWVLKNQEKYTGVSVFLWMRALTLGQSSCKRKWKSLGEHRKSSLNTRKI